MNQSTNLKYVIFLACTAALGGLLFGLDIAIITGAGPFIQRAFSLGDLALGWAFSSLLFGCVVGSAFAGRLADRYGRRHLLLIVACLFAVTSIATGMAWNFPSFVTARLLGGLAVGGSFGMAVSLLLLVVAVLTGNFHGLLVLGLILVYLAFFSSCIGPVFWTLVPEIFPDDVRGMAMTVPVLLQWIANARGALLSLCVPRNREGVYLWFPRGDVRGAGIVYLALRA